MDLRLLSLVVAALYTAALLGCGGDDYEDAGTTAGATTSLSPAESATAVRTSAPTRTLTSTPTPAPPTSPSPAPAEPYAAAALAALNGLRCTGQWRNTTLGTSGALSLTVEAGGGGGRMTFEIGGPVFGATGGVFEAPFRLEARDIVIDSPSEFLGRVRARLAIDGSAGEGTLEAPPALGQAARVTMTAYSLADNVLAAAFTIDYGDGRAPASSVIEAACAQAR